jgi:hypothetical protein
MTDIYAAALNSIKLCGEHSFHCFHRKTKVIPLSAGCKEPELRHVNVCCRCQALGDYWANTEHITIPKVCRECFNPRDYCGCK